MQSRNPLDIQPIPPCSPEDHFSKLIFLEHSWFTGLPGWHFDKEFAYNAGSCRIPWTEEPDGLPSMGFKELDMTEATEHAGIVDLQCCVSFRCIAK